MKTHGSKRRGRNASNRYFAMLLAQRQKQLRTILGWLVPLPISTVYVYRLLQRLGAR